MIHMNQKLKYIGLLAVLPVFAAVMTSNFVSASALEQGNGANRHATALYDPFLVCGDHLCNPAEKKAREHGLGPLVGKVDIGIKSR